MTVPGQPGGVCKPKRLAVGRIVRFVKKFSDTGSPIVRPAIVTRVYPDGITANLQVFSDTHHGSTLRKRVAHSYDCDPGTWHWSPSQDEIQRDRLHALGWFPHNKPADEAEHA